MSIDLKETIERQKQSIAELSEQVERIAKSDIALNHQELQARYEKLSARQEEAQRAKDALTIENAGLKTTLYEQYYSEKIQWMTKRQNQLEIYFASKIAGEQNRLFALEQDIERRIDHMLAELSYANLQESYEIYGKLHALREEANAKIGEARAKLVESAALNASERAELDRLKAEALEGEQIAALSKKKNIERFIGLNILNTIGILLILLGVITAGQFVYTQVSDLLRGIALFALGALFLASGEILNRKTPNIFSLGITAGGAGILYAALAVSYFGLGILNMYAALFICIAITAATFFLSTRYNAQTLLAIALVGGYLPIFSLGPERTLLFAMMGYFVLLNLLALSVAFYRKWTIASFVGLALNLIGMFALASQIWHIHPLHERVLGTVYIAFAMLIYIVIPLVNTHAAKTGFKPSDVVLLSINAFFGGLILFNNLNSFDWWNYAGLASAILAAVYLGLGYIVARRFQGAKSISALFFITGLTLLVLFVPFQLNAMWFSLGWLVQGTGLAIYGIIKERRGFRLSGFIIAGICLFWFLSYDSFFLSGALFPWRYFSITMASLLIMAAFIYKRAINSNFQRAFKYCAAINLWWYALYLINRLQDILAETFYGMSLRLDYLTTASMAVTTLMFAIVYPRIPLLLDKGMKIIALTLNVLGILWMFAITLTINPLRGPIADMPLGIAALATLILIAVAAIGAFAVYDLTRRLVLERVMGIQYLPLLVSAYIVILFTVNLIQVYALTFSSFLISIAYVCTALLWTILGFVKRYALLRRFGLGLALLSVTKLFLIDLATLTQGFRILSYFILGTILVAISYVYQYFNKRLELATVGRGFPDAPCAD